MKEGKNIKLIIAGGGTGGHIFPAIAIANAMKHVQPSCEILFVGAKGKMEMEKVPKEGYKIIGLDIAGFDRNNLIKNISLPFKLIKSFLQARKIVKDFKPNAVVGVGGYASFPVLYMAQKAGIASLVQEQNSFAGKSNKILAQNATTVCVAYSNMDRFFPAEKIMNTGNPVRKAIANSQVTKEEGVDFFQLNKNQKIIFAFGGSLGAKSINDTLIVQFKQITDTGAQLIWQTGTTSFASAKEAVKGMEDKVKVFEFIREMEYAYAAADIIISRSGASSISELCIVGKPVIFVPFPFASEDHQTHNAMALVNENAALMVKNSEVNNELINNVMLLLNDEVKCKQMSDNCRKLAIVDADNRIAYKIIEIAK